MQTKKVILHFRLNGVPGRNQLNGIFRFLGRLGNWDLRLTQSESILECITRIRLEEVKKRLTSSDASIATIAQACGCEVNVQYS